MFNLSKPQKEIQKAAREFARGEFDKELANEWEQSGTFPETIWKKAAELGFIGIHFPEQYSGGGLGLFENTLVIEAFCRADPSIGSALAQSSQAAETLLRFGSEPLKMEILPKIAEGNMLLGRAFSENERGGDYTRISAIAQHQGDNWLVNGEKTHVLNGVNAGAYVVLCRTGFEDDPVEKRLSLLLVENSSKGIEIRPNGRRLGNNMVSSATIRFNQVSVPEANLIGREGQGFKQLQRYLAEEHVLIAAQALGNALASYDRVLAYIKGREQFGRKIATFQVSKHKIADMATRIELSRLMLHKAAIEIDRGKPNAATCAMAKGTACEAAMHAGAQAIQLFGGYGYMTEYEVERFYRDAKSMEVREGGQEVQNDIISNEFIGKIK